MDEARNRPTSVVSDQLHPLVYGAMTALVLCLGLGIVGSTRNGGIGIVGARRRWVRYDHCVVAGSAVLEQV